MPVRHDIGDLGVALAMLETACGGRRHHGACHGGRGKCSSRQAEVRRTSSSVQSGARASTRATRGVASVSVPVLSNTMVSAAAMASKCLAPLTVMPS